RSAAPASAAAFGVLTGQKIPTRRPGEPGAASGCVIWWTTTARPIVIVPVSSDRVLDRLDRARPDDLPGRLGLEHHLFLGEGVDALARLGGGLLDDDEFRKAGNDEDAGLLQLLVADGCERLHDALDVPLGELGMGFTDLLDQLRLRQIVRHCC